VVKLNRIYTKTGDNGTTGLGDGSRVRKDDIRVEAFGTVDEANAALGLACSIAIRHAGQTAAAIAPLLSSIQNDLFDVGADLCCPIEAGEKPDGRLRVVASQTARLEQAIDRFNAHLAPLTSFILPGGTELASALHLARTVTRRAERLTVTLYEFEKTATNPETIRYLNRLSDLLFVLARTANGSGGGGQGDILWVPGQQRPQQDA
jgi:cob(I)alamin adenosyltransferase